jgi:hypothetical protein
MSRTSSLTILALIVANAIGCASQAEPKSATKTEAVAASKMLTPAARAADPVYAYVDDVRADLSNGKARIINKVMRLSPEESAKFWPIYQEYEEELFALGDQRVEMTRALVNAEYTRSLDDAKAASLTDQWFDFESKRLELVRKHQKRVASELSPLRAAQFTQLEHRFATVVDLMLASELPLVQVVPNP